ncbi:MAG: NAD(P)H-dependent glycerol-3-phosphate dehydrogenase [Puniceicoccales bacterium]|jgi:glycerol-3-phosphate dehydrogenase (NAD(P)+)|nr:NAD(P)H-dependent glycerol-3-phosphate dehydrogenase [Puniceicoccales bacterium]
MPAEIAKKKCAVLGAGAWGTAMAIHMARRGFTAFLVPRDGAHGERMERMGANDAYLPGIAFPKNLWVERSFAILSSVDLAFLACPSVGVVEFCRRVADLQLPPDNRPTLVTLCKGLIPETLRLPLSAVEEQLPGWKVAVLSGPTHARDVAIGQPAAAVLASSHGDGLLAALQSAIHSSEFRLYRTDDVRGVELGGCLKNPYAIGMGMASTQGFGDNGHAALFTRMLWEMARIGDALGGRRETFFGLSGLGDFLATANGRWSRNRSLGERIGLGEDPAKILETEKITVEGYRATAGFWNICHSRAIPCPILDEIYAVLYHGKSLGDSFLSLVQRDMREGEADFARSSDK